MGAGSGFTNLPVSETDARLQSGGHMGWKMRGEGGCGVSVMMGGGLVRLLGAVEAVARGKLLCRMELKARTQWHFTRVKVKSAHNGT